LHFADDLVLLVSSELMLGFSRHGSLRMLTKRERKHSPHAQERMESMRSKNKDKTLYAKTPTQRFIWGDAEVHMPQPHSIRPLLWWPGNKADRDEWNSQRATSLMSKGSRNFLYIMRQVRRLRFQLQFMNFW